MENKTIFMNAIVRVFLDFFINEIIVDSGIFCEAGNDLSLRKDNSISMSVSRANYPRLKDTLHLENLTPCDYYLIQSSCTGL